ncbi:DUF456 domain-containing protein [Haloglomus salinum]|jgi:uncharacterized protein YqgC (DUF456 family)|uniref:DUF456 domain-containing protein n=1 Tax=Haloglomus salinum TaxID=2962673 RepID=UPI0020C9C747|nr:DUF456 domain-containing protein [Haloglomus salinum]
MLGTVEAVWLAALALLLVGILGSLVPGLPGPALSLAGVLSYWWATDYTTPGTLALAGLVALGLLGLAADWFAAPLGAKAGGASTRTTAIAGVVGFVLLFVLGPLGVVVGVAGTVFLLELRGSGDPRGSLRAAGTATVAVLGSALAQLVVTGAMLVGFLLVA